MVLTNHFTKAMYLFEVWFTFHLKLKFCDQSKISLGAASLAGLSSTLDSACLPLHKSRARDSALFEASEKASSDSQVVSVGAFSQVFQFFPSCKKMTLAIYKMLTCKRKRKNKFLTSLAFVMLTVQPVSATWPMMPFPQGILTIFPPVTVGKIFVPE